MSENYTYNFKMPKDWTLINFPECCEKISLNGIKIKQKDYQPAGKFPVVDQGQELIGGYFNNDELVVPGEPPFVIFGDHTKVKKYINFKFIAGADGVKVLKPYAFFNPKLFYYFIHCVRLPDKGYARHFQFLEKVEYPIPPLPEQHVIVSKIDQLFSELDRGIESLKTAQQQLKVYRQSVLQWAFEGKLTNDNVIEGELPEGWKWVKVKDIGNIDTGMTPSKAYPKFYANDFPFFKPTDLKAGINVRMANDNLSKEGIEHARYLKSNSILVTCIGATIGKTGLIRVDGACNQQINSISPH